MDIDDFLDRELSDLGLETGKSETPDTAAPRADDIGSPFIENIRAQLLKGNIDLAEQSYVQLWTSLFQKKLKWDKELYGQLYALSRQVQSAVNQSFASTKRKADHIHDLISRGRAALIDGKKDVPFKIYSEIEEMSNSIPDAFFEQKRVIREQVMDYYRDLRNSTDNELVGRVASLLQEVTNLIDKTNASMARNDTVNAILNYNQCIGLYNQIPEGFLYHKNSASIMLLQIYKSLSIFDEISLLQKELASGIQQPQNSKGAPGQLVHSAPFPSEIKSKLQSIQKSTMQELDSKAKTLLLKEKRDRAKKNIEKGFYSDASRDIDEALKIEPNDAEAKAINAKLKTLQ